MSEFVEPFRPARLSYEDIRVRAEVFLNEYHPARTIPDPALRAGVSAATKIISLVSVQLLGPEARPTTAARMRRWDDVKEIAKHARVVHIGSGELHGERNSLGIDHNMALRARFPFIRRIRASFGSPFFAGMLLESSAARLQSIASASASRSSITRHTLSQTPASCQSRNLRQHVIPDPEPISCGKYSHGIPVFNTKMIPARHARSGTLGRPPRHLALRFCFGNSGSITAHSSSPTNSCTHIASNSAVGNTGSIHHTACRATPPDPFC
jgi:hypothetical protein